MLNYFPTGRTIEIEEEVGTIFKKKIKKQIPIVRMSLKPIRNKRAHVIALLKRLKEISNTPFEKHIERGLYHTFPSPYFDEDEQGIRHTIVISPTEYDYIALHNFFGLLGAAIAVKTRDTPDTIDDKLMDAFMETWKELRKKGYLQEFGEIIPESFLEDKNPHTIPALLHPPWEKLKNDKQFLDVVLNTYSKHTGIPREKIEQHLDDIIKAVDAVTEAAMKRDDLAELIEKGEIPELERVIYILAGKKPGERQPAKFKQVQKQVEAELRAKGLPEDVKLEVLSILQALEFADYSKKAKEKALEKLTSMLEELSKEKLTPENLQKIGLIVFTAEIIKRGEFKRAEEIKKL